MQAVPCHVAVRLENSPWPVLFRIQILHSSRVLAAFFVLSHTSFLWLLTVINQPYPLLASSSAVKNVARANNIELSFR